MTYTATLSVLNFGDDPAPPSVAVRLWRVWTTITDDGVATEHQSELASATVPAGTNTAFTLPPNAVAADPSDQVCLTVDNPTEPGAMFRSAHLPSLPNAPDPAAVVSVFLAGAQTISPADVTSGLPAVPIAAGAGITITGLTATPVVGAIAVTATGTIPSPGGGIGFTATFSVFLEPEGLQHPERPLAVSISTPVMTFAGAGPDAVAAVVLDVLQPFFVESVVEPIRGRVVDGVNAAAIAKAAQALAPNATPLPTTLPAGVTLSVERVVADPTGVTVFAGLNSFGSLRALLFPGAPTGGGGCALGAIALLPAIGSALAGAARNAVLARIAARRASPVPV